MSEPYDDERRPIEGVRILGAEEARASLGETARPTTTPADLEADEPQLDLRAADLRARRVGRGPTTSPPVVAAGPTRPGRRASPTTSCPAASVRAPIRSPRSMRRRRPGRGTGRRARRVPTTCPCARRARRSADRRGPAAAALDRAAHRRGARDLRRRHRDRRTTPTRGRRSPARSRGSAPSSDWAESDFADDLSRRAREARRARRTTARSTRKPRSRATSPPADAAPAAAPRARAGPAPAARPARGRAAVEPDADEPRRAGAGPRPPDRDHDRARRSRSSRSSASRTTRTTVALAVRRRRRRDARVRDARCASAGCARRRWSRSSPRRSCRSPRVTTAPRRIPCSSRWS